MCYQMKINPSMGGYFKNGQFFSFNQEIDSCDLYSCLDDEHKKFVEALENNSRDYLAMNLVCMPNLMEIKQIGDSRFSLIFREAYFSIAYGNYNSGLLLLGQLLELITKEIILIHTGKSLPRATFGNAIQHAEDKKIILQEDIKFLKKFNEDIRNVYSHYKLEEIIGRNTRVPLWKIPIDTSKTFDPEEFLYNLIKVQEGIREGKYPPTFIDPLELPTIAAAMKGDIDRPKSIWWLWWTTLKLDQFFKIYLTQGKYQEYLVKFREIPYKDVISVSL